MDSFGTKELNINSGSTILRTRSFFQNLNKMKLGTLNESEEQIIQIFVFKLYIKYYILFCAPAAGISSSYFFHRLTNLVMY